ncbi:hypothetical protein PEC18_29705 [Paucibacter sp. O1-1]|nr:hypothetical protein [Paucibacter sp. O1-1]MDA3829917.1 hypothetical protein [Paucibacter sp. O1-1]
MFLYLHFPGEDYAASNTLLKQYIVRHKLKGTHLLMNSNQMMDLLFRLNPFRRRNIFHYQAKWQICPKKCPAPSATEKTAAAILEADKQ